MSALPGQPALPSSGDERSRCARLARELLLQAEQVSRERPPEVAPLLLAGLYRDAARWALLAVPEGRAEKLEPEARRTVLDTDPKSDAALGAAALGAELELRARVAKNLVAEATPPPSLPVRRIISWGVIALVAALVGSAGFAIGKRVLAAPNLAEGKPWRTSSTFAECHPDQMDCGGTRTAIFFHTQEDAEPWLELDLMAPARFSSVVVRNRGDAARERAVPLIVEVSDDQAAWKELARRDELFDEWVAKFEPVTARYVRLRVPRRSMLHLEAVRVLP